MAVHLGTAGNVSFDDRFKTIHDKDMYIQMDLNLLLFGSEYMTLACGKAFFMFTFSTWFGTCLNYLNCNYRYPHLVLYIIYHHFLDILLYTILR